MEIVSLTRTSPRSLQGFSRWTLPLALALGCASNSGGSPSNQNPALPTSAAAGTSGLPTAGTGVAGQAAPATRGTAGSTLPATMGTAGTMVTPPPTTGAAGTPAGTGGVSATAGMGAAGTMAAAGTGAAGMGAAGTGAMMNYAPLQASQIGAPVMVSSTFTLAESPLWDRCNKRLLFVDVTPSVIRTVDSSGQLGMLAMNTNHANGIAWDVDGTSLILAQMDGHIARLDKTGAIKAIEPAGSSLHTPDDVVVRSDGTIYFTDGDFPPVSANLLGAFSQLPVYMMKPGATTLVNGGMVGGPNGIELSPDEKKLYVDGYGDNAIYSFDVATDGSLSNKKSLAASVSSPDSLCLDAAGNLYVGVKTGLQVLTKDGMAVTLIPATSSSGTTNCTFGGDDGKTLYITAWTTLFKVENMPIPGLDWVVGQTRQKCM